MNFCKDCAHFKPFSHATSADRAIELGDCTRPSIKLNPVTGKSTLVDRGAIVERMSEDPSACGEPGRFFQAKEATNV